MKLARVAFNLYQSHLYIFRFGKSGLKLMQTIKSSGAESKGMQVSYFSFIYVQNCQALSISQSLNPSLSLRDRDRADTIITFHHPPTTTKNFLST